MTESAPRLPSPSRTAGTPEPDRTTPPCPAHTRSPARLPQPSARTQSSQRGLLCALALLVVFAGPMLAAQALVASSSADPSTLPDAPDAPQTTPTPAPGAPANNAAPPPPASPQQTKRILGVLPNFRAVSAGTTLPPQTAKDKFKTGLADSFDYSSFIFAGAQAGIAQGTNSYPAFHQGAAGYARYFWHTFADQADENLLVESILPAVTHEDSRYYTLGQGGFLKRSVYAISRAAITRSDHGGETVNLSEIVGAGGAAGISALYYPDQYATWTKTGQRWLTNIILDDALLYVKEFWPDINQAIFHKAD